MTVNLDETKTNIKVERLVPEYRSSYIIEGETSRGSITTVNI